MSFSQPSSTMKPKQSLEDLQEKLKIVQEYKDKMASGDFQLFPEDAVTEERHLFQTASVASRIPGHPVGKESEHLP